ncbi:MAG: hypothetical protein ACO3IB_10645, partial [Phycisphaerales bacterium]
SADDDQLANSWTDDDAVDQCRRRVERRAFEALLVESRKTWTSIAEQRARQIAAAADRGPSPRGAPAAPDASNGAPAASAP